LRSLIVRLRKSADDMALPDRPSSAPVNGPRTTGQLDTLPQHNVWERAFLIAISITFRRCWHTTLRGACTCSWCRCDSLDRPVMVWIMLSENFHRTFSADYEDQVPSRVIKDVVSVTDCRQASNDSPRSCVQNNQPGGQSAPDEQPFVGLIHSSAVAPIGYAISVWIFERTGWQDGFLKTPSSAAAVAIKERALERIQTAHSQVR